MKCPYCGGVIEMRPTANDRLQPYCPECDIWLRSWQIKTPEKVPIAIVHRSIKPDGFWTHERVSSWLHLVQDTTREEAI
jgi:hypothetical protein